MSKVTQQVKSKDANPSVSEFIVHTLNNHLAECELHKGSTFFCSVHCCVPSASIVSGT